MMSLTTESVVFTAYVKMTTICFGTGKTITAQLGFLVEKNTNIEALLVMLRDSQKLYLMQNAMNLNKIGISKNPEVRRRQLELTSGVPIHIIKCWTTLDAPAREVEQALHRIFSRRRLQGEWFTKISIADIEFAGYDLLECNHNGTTKRI